MKQITLTLETAKEMYNSNSPSLKQFALDNYTEEELTKKEFPKEWNNNYGLMNLNGCYCNSSDTAKGLAILAKLITMRDKWWEIDNNWKPNYSDNKYKYIIYTNYNSIGKGTITTVNFILVFRTAEIRDEFYEAFKELIEQAKPLL